MDADSCLQHLNTLEQVLRSLPGGTAAEALASLERARASCAAEFHTIARLEESEERWRAIATNPFDYVSIIDADAVFLYVNRTAPGLREEDLIGRASIYDWTAPENHVAIRDAVASAFHTGRPTYYEAYSPPLGAWFGSVIGPIVRDGKVVALSLQARDITQRRQAEQALRDSEERFRQLAENIDDVFFLIEPAAGKVVYTSPAYERLWGRPLRRIYEDMGDWLEGTHPEDRSRLRGRFEAMIAVCRGEDVGFVFAESMPMRVVRPDGTVRHVRTRLFPVRDPWGRVQRVAGVVSDFTELAESEMKLAAAEVRFRTLVEKLPVISYITRLHGANQVLYISPQIESKLGFPAQAWMTDGFWLSRVHPDDRERVQGLVRRFVEGGAALRSRYRMLAQDDTVLWFHDEAVAVGGTQEEPTVQGVLLDVSEAELARADQQRTRAGASHLVEVQESERRHLAQELHDEVGQTLTSLSFMLQSVRECPGESPTVVHEARALVWDLLERVRNLSLDLRPSMLDDLGLLPTLLWMFDRYTKQTRVAVRFEHRGMDSRFSTELETAAYRVVQEALTNVARHAEVQEVDVRASCDGATLSLQIEDNGTGFASQDLNGRMSSGLAGMQERVELLGGELFIDSQPGRGTHISARLPVNGRHRGGPDFGGGVP